MADKTTEKTTEKKGFFRHWIVANLLKAAGICLALLVGAIVFLNLVTQHNRELQVPDFRGMTVQEAEKAADKAGVRVEVIDSVYSQRYRGRVKNHTPSPGTMVKKGRRVLLTVNAINAKKVTVPNLVGYSLRQAIPELNMRGLELGRIIYKTDMATNNVLQQLYRGSSVNPGAQVEAESVIDLVVGLNSSDCRTLIPDVIGKDEREARKTLHDSYLNVKSAVFDADVKTWEDSLSAVVYKQTPASSQYSVGMGTDVTIYLKKAEEVQE